MWWTRTRILQHNHDCRFLVLKLKYRQPVALFIQPEFDTFIFFFIFCVFLFFWMLGHSYEKLDNHQQKSRKLGRHINDKKTFQLFRNVVYEVDDRMPEFTKMRVSNMELCENFGQRSMLDKKLIEEKWRDMWKLCIWSKRNNR